MGTCARLGSRCARLQFGLMAAVTCTGAKGEPHLNRNAATKATLRPTRGWSIGAVRARSDVQAVVLVGERDADDRLALRGPEKHTHDLAKPDRVPVRPDKEAQARQAVVARSTLASGRAERDRLRVRAWRPALCTVSEFVGAGDRRTGRRISVDASFELELHEANLKEQHQQMPSH
jgi:hypothetical protein